jgi:hypothetical protein
VEEAFTLYKARIEAFVAEQAAVLADKIKQLEETVTATEEAEAAEAEAAMVFGQ